MGTVNEIHWCSLNLIHEEPTKYATSPQNASIISK